MSMTDDDQLMIRIQEGDVSALDALVNAHQSALVGFFFHNTRDVQLAEDLTQETLLRVYNQAWDYLPVGKFKPWMYRIARNLLIDSVRRQSHDALVKAVKGHSEAHDAALGCLVDEVISPADQAQHREFTDLIDGLLAELPYEQRQTFTMHHFSGLSLSEVADAMDTSLPTAKSRLRLAREKLQEKLQQRGVAGPASTT
jgi:RNA polymerase sigma-70 factor (ECF subfamily)